MALIYDSSHSGQEIDAAVDAVQTTIPSQLTQIGLKLDNLDCVLTGDYFTESVTAGSGYIYITRKGRYFMLKNGIPYSFTFTSESALTSPIYIRLMLSETDNNDFIVSKTFPTGTTSYTFNLTPAQDYPNVFIGYGCGVATDITVSVTMDESSVLDRLDDLESAKDEVEADLNEKIGELQQRVVETDGGVISYTPQWTILNKYLNNNGGLANGNGWAISAPILLKKGMAIAITTQGANCTVIASTDSSASSYTPLVKIPSGTTSGTYTYNATADIYVAVAGKIVNGDVVCSMSAPQKYLTLTQYDEGQTDIMAMIYGKAAIPEYASQSGKLKVNGDWQSDSSCVCKKYAVTAGGILYLKVSADTAGVFQFQNTATIKSSGNQTNIIGETYTEEYDGLITVPEGATYLIVSQLASNTTNVVDILGEHDMTIGDIADELKPYNVTKVLNVKGRNDLPKYFSLKSGCRYSLSVIAANSPAVDPCYVSLRVGDTVLLSANIVVGATSNSNSFVAAQDYENAYIYIYCNDNTIVGSLDVTFVDGGTIYGKVDELEERVTRLEEDNPDTIIGLNGKSDTLNRLEQMKRQPRVSATTQGITPFVFAHFSDLHADATNLARIIEYCTEYNGYIDEMIHTGDAASARGTDSFTWWGNVSGSEDILVTMGNHDAAGANDADFHSGGFGKVNCYNQYIAPYVSNWGVTQPANAAANGYNYYYKDYADAKVRIIALDCMYWDSAQNSWLQSVLADAKTNSLAVICFSHYSGGKVTSFGNPWTTLQYDDVSSIINAEAPATIQSFIDGGGEFVAWFSGHTHYDFMGTLDNYPQQIDITIDTASRSAASYSDIARVVGQKSQDLFNIVGIDTFRKLIKIYRVGADRDSWMRHKGCITIDYSTRQVLYYD